MMQSFVVFAWFNIIVANAPIMGAVDAATSFQVVNSSFFVVTFEVADTHPRSMGPHSIPSFSILLDS
jgi:hypothetical protein